jgi:photosystem II stability/assembly factor-like uncharacterized protein
MKLIAALCLALLMALSGHAEYTSLDVEPPFRLKDIQVFGSGDPFGERWSVGGSGGLVITTWNGQIAQTRSNITKADLNALFFVDHRTAFVVGSLGEILLTRDRGKTWQKQQSGTDMDLESVFCLDEDTCWIVGSKKGTLLTGGVDGKWKLKSIVSDGEFTDIFFADKQTGYAVGWDGLVLKTGDGGESWTRINIGYKARVSPLMDGVVNFESVVFKDANTGCLAGWKVGGSIIACTEDAGENWNTSYVEPRPIGLIWKGEGNVLLIGGSGKNIVSTDKGRTWNRQEFTFTSRKPPIEKNN